MTGRPMTRKEVRARYDAEIEAIRAAKAHPHATSMAVNEARRWLERALDAAIPDTDADGVPCLLIEHGSHSLSLGERLRGNISRIEREAREAEAAKQRAEQRRMAEQRERCLAWFDRWTEEITEAINSGKSPAATRIPGYVEGSKGWQGSINEPGNENHWLWRETMVPWAQKEGLELVITHDHDGMGMESWRKIGVQPA